MNSLVRLVTPVKNSPSHRSRSRRRKYMYYVSDIVLIVYSVIQVAIGLNPVRQPLKLIGCMIYSTYLGLIPH